MKEQQNILISRTDAIGDVVLSLPITGILRNMYPNCKIYFLGQTYTKDVIEICEHVNQFIDWNDIKKLSITAQVNYFKSLEIGVALHVFPNIHISWLLKESKIPIRIGTSRRWYHWLFCNQLVSFSRRHSNLHESQLNTNLLSPLGLKQLLPLQTMSQFYGLNPSNITQEWESIFDKNKFNLILHPKSRGNGKEWGLENYAKLIELLDPNRYKIFITGTHNEWRAINHEILHRYSNVIDLVGKMKLSEFIGFISRADGIVASGTGPLHLAAALGIHAIGVYPPIRPVFSKRWAPVGQNSKAFEAKKICVKCKKQSRCDCLKLLNPKIIFNYLNKLHKPNLENHPNYELFHSDSGVTEGSVALQGTDFGIIISKKRKQRFASIENLTHKTKVLISLDKINKPNCGLGRVAIDFSQALANQHTNSTEFTFVVNGSNYYEHLEGQKIKRLLFLNRLFPANYGQYNILHKLHQSPSFKINGAKQSVLTIHDLNFLITKGKSKARGYLREVQKNVDNANAIVFISNFTREICYKNLNIPSTKITQVIYNGVDFPDIMPQMPGFINNSKYLFSIGQFLTKKNFHVLIPFLSKINSNLKLILAGENNTVYGSYIRRLINEYKLEDRVILAGPISEAEKVYLYQNCEAFVFPSLAEGFGLPIIEAMRVRKPVFCSDKTSLKEIGDKHVFFWETFEPDYMLQVYLKGISEFNEEKSCLAYEYSMKYTWETNANAYLDLYNTVAANA